MCLNKVISLSLLYCIVFTFKVSMNVRLILFKSRISHTCIFKTIHQILICGKILSKWESNVSQNCNLCNKEDDISHNYYAFHLYNGKKCMERCQPYSSM